VYNRFSQEHTNRRLLLEPLGDCPWLRRWRQYLLQESTQLNPFPTARVATTITITIAALIMQDVQLVNGGFANGKARVKAVLFLVVFAQAEIAKRAAAESRPIVDVAVEATGLPREELARLLDPARLARNEVDGP
jgi:hypothetical protein